MAAAAGTTVAAPEPAAVGFGAPIEAAVAAEPEAVAAEPEAEQAPVEAGPEVEAEQAAGGVEPVDWGWRLPAEAVRRPRKTGRRRRVGFHN